MGQRFHGGGSLARRPARQPAALLDLVEEEPEISISINLEDQLVTLPDGQTLGFPIDPFRKLCLLNGVDDLGYIQSKDAAILAYEAVTAY